MAKAIYRRTMRRAHSGRPGDSENGAVLPPPPSFAAPPTGANGSQETTGSSAQPLVNHTMHVDRQVARQARSRSKRRQIRRLWVLVAFLLVGVVVLASGWILAWEMVKDERQKKAAIVTNLNKTQRALEQTRAKLKDREQEVVTLVENRIPGLKLIEFNKLQDVNDKYLLNVTFSESGIEHAKALEYHAMLVNTGTRMVLPRVKIYFFDEIGLQVGVVNLDKEHATSDVALAELEPGETRSYHAQIPIERDAVPKYYILYVE